MDNRPLTTTMNQISVQVEPVAGTVPKVAVTTVNLNPNVSISRNRLGSEATHRGNTPLAVINLVGRARCCNR